MSADRSAVLREANAIVSEQLAQMRRLAEHTRREVETLSSELRRVERQLDEVLLRGRAAAERRLPAAPELKRQQADLRARCDSLAEALHTKQHALKQIEQFVRQIEMSSGALEGGEDAASADPWILALRAQVIHGREEERLRLAREVHDGPAQVLANSLMVLESAYGVAQELGQERLLTMLDRLRGATREGLADVRRFITELRPGKLDEQGLVPAIDDLVRRYTAAYGAHVTFESEPLPRLPREVEIVLYRIVQEALQNAHKHARSAPITVRLSRQSEGLRLVVRDEGPGFDPREVARRAGRTNWGLTSMRERAELIGAGFTVASRPGHGTEVQLSLPLRT